jgi:hypothetical protein
MVGGASPNDGPNRVAVCFGIGEPFQNDGTASFSTSETVGGRIKCFATSIGCECPGAAQKRGDFWTENQLDPGGHSHVTFVRLQTLTG